MTLAAKLRETKGHVKYKEDIAMPTLHSLLVQDNLLYFLGRASDLVKSLEPN